MSFKVREEQNDRVPESLYHNPELSPIISSFTNKENEKPLVNSDLGKKQSVLIKSQDKGANQATTEVSFNQYRDKYSESIRLSEFESCAPDYNKRGIIGPAKADKNQKLEQNNSYNRELNLEKFKQLQQKISNEQNPARDQEEFKIRDYDTIEDLEMTKTFGKEIFSRPNYSESNLTKNSSDQSSVVSEAHKQLSSKASELSYQMMTRFQSNQHSEISLTKSVANSVSTNHNTYVIDNLIKENPSIIQLRSPSTINDQKRSLGLIDTDLKNCYSGSLDIQDLKQNNSTKILSTFDSYTKDGMYPNDDVKSRPRDMIEDYGSQDYYEVGKLTGKAQNLQKESKKFVRQISPLLQKSEEIKLSQDYFERAKKVEGRESPVCEDKIVKSIKIEDIQDDEDQRVILQQFKEIIISPEPKMKQSQSTEAQLEKIKNFESGILDIQLDPVDQLVMNMRSVEENSKLQSPNTDFDFKNSVGKLQLDSKVMKLNLQGISKNLPLLPNSKGDNLYGSITFYDDEAPAIQGPEKEKGKKMQEQDEDEANSENSFINYDPYDNYDEQNQELKLILTRSSEVVQSKGTENKQSPKPSPFKSPEKSEVILLERGSVEIHLNTPESTDSKKHNRPLLNEEITPKEDSTMNQKYASKPSPSKKDKSLSHHQYFSHQHNISSHIASMYGNFSQEIIHELSIENMDSVNTVSSKERSKIQENSIENLSKNFDSKKYDSHSAKTENSFQSRGNGLKQEQEQNAILFKKKSSKVFDTELIDNLRKQNQSLIQSLKDKDSIIEELRQNYAALQSSVKDERISRDGEIMELKAELEKKFKEVKILKEFTKNLKKKDTKEQQQLDDSFGQQMYSARDHVINNRQALNSNARKVSISESEDPHSLKNKVAIQSFNIERLTHLNKDMELEQIECKKQLEFMLEELELLNKYKVTGHKENYQISFALKKVGSMSSLQNSLAAVNDVIVMLSKSIVSNDQMEYKVREQLREIDEKDFLVDQLQTKIRRYEMKLEQLTINYDVMVKRFEEELLKQKELHSQGSQNYKEAYLSYRSVCDALCHHILNSQQANLLEEFSLLLDQMTQKKDPRASGGRMSQRGVPQHKIERRLQEIEYYFSRSNNRSGSVTNRSSRSRAYPQAQACR